MTSRRRFLGAATALPLLPVARDPTPRGLAGRSAPHTASATSGGPLLALVDTRVALSRAFGRALGQRGAGVVALDDGDVAAAWPALASRIADGRQGVALAGLVDPGIAFCVGELLRPSRFATRWHAEHRVGEQRVVAHLVFHDSSPPGGPTARTTAGAATWQPDRSAAWPAALATSLCDALARPAGDVAPGVPMTPSTPAATAVPVPLTLTSFLLVSR